jgi:hypothetical protein
MSKLGVRIPLGVPKSIIMSETGRYFVIDQKTKRKFCVEPITGNRTNWGDLDPATKKLTGSYGQKHQGSIDIDESIITEENGFKNIELIPVGVSPEDYINKLLGCKDLELLF